MTRSNRRRSGSFSRRTKRLHLLESLEARHLLTSLTGVVYEDLDSNQQLDDTDIGIPGAVVYVDANNNGVLDQTGFGLEPDANELGEILNNSNQLVFPSATGIDNQPLGIVRTALGNAPPTGDLVFANSESSNWDNQQRLRFDFTLSVNSVSIDVAGADPQSNVEVILEAYDIDGELLASDSAQNLLLGDFDRLAIERTEDDIQYVVVYVPDNRGEAQFDNLRANSAEDELSTITNSSGGFALRDLPEQAHVLRQVVPEGFEQTSPEDAITTPVADVVGGLNFGNRTSSIGGLVFNDVGTPGVFEPGLDTGIAGAALYLDTNNNGVPDAATVSVDPGTFLMEQPLEFVSDEARFTVVNANNVSTSEIVTADDDPVVSPDGQIFTRSGDAAWTSDNRLRVDLQTPASEVKLDFIAASDDAAEQGILIAFSPNGDAIATATTQLLARGQQEQLTITRPNFEISYVVAYTLNSANPLGRLDNFEATIVDEPVAISNDSGNYLFRPLPSGVYRVAALTSGGQSVTLPSDDNVREIEVSEGSDELNADFGLQTENQPPVAEPDQAEIVEDSPVPIGVLTNDFDVDGDINLGSIQITQEPVNGTAEVTTNGFINYTPNANFTGTDTLIYTVSDDQAAVSNSGVVTITVTPVNDAPLAANDQVAVLFTAFGVPASTVINVLANDVDVDGTLDISSLAIDSPPGNGTATINATTGTITYNANGLGEDSFTYTIADDTGLASIPATVTVSSLGLGSGNSPVALDDSFSTREGTAVEIDIVANDTDIDGEVLADQITIIEPSAVGSVSIIEDSVTFTPVLGFIGEATFSYQVRDNDLLASNTAEVTIDITERDFPFQNPINPLDVDPDGFIIPRDALIIINEINNRQFSDPVTGELASNPDPGSVPEAFFDVNGDGFVAAIDVLQIINFINDQGSAEAPSAEPPVEANADAAAAFTAAFATNFDPFEVFEDDEDEENA